MLLHHVIIKRRLVCSIINKKYIKTYRREFYHKRISNTVCSYSCKILTKMNKIALLLFISSLYLLLLVILHRVCSGAPYYPIDGAIEYVFNTLQTRLKLRMAHILNEATLRRELSDGIRSILTFVPYFQHVGFWRTQ